LHDYNINKLAKPPKWVDCHAAFSYFVHLSTCLTSIFAVCRRSRYQRRITPLLVPGRYRIGPIRFLPGGVKGDLNRG